MGRPRIGAVSYLNTKPLVAGLSSDAPDYELVFDLPSRLADRLASHELDVGLIPVIEAILDPRYTIVSDACIACRGPVWSVKLMSRVDWREIRTLALDEGSRTSCALARVLLDQSYGVRPQCTALPLDDDWKDAPTDAVLIIGDRAMKAEDSAFPYCWDLGEVWNGLTGKPFVFAVWAARTDKDLDGLGSLLSVSRDRGLETIETIARQQAENYGLSHAECLRYLKNHLHFQLGVEEKSAMDLFFRNCVELSLTPRTTQLNFHDCQTAG